MSLNHRLRSIADQLPVMFMTGADGKTITAPVRRRMLGQEILDKNIKLQNMSRLTINPKQFYTIVLHEPKRANHLDNLMTCKRAGKEVINDYIAKVYELTNKPRPESHCI